MMTPLLSMVLAGLLTPSTWNDPDPRTDPERAAFPNILIITVDDMNWDSTGVTGSSTPAITPNIDQLATEGMLIEHAHVAATVCSPSRKSLMTGLFPHEWSPLAKGPVESGVITLYELLGQAGFLNANLGKLFHLQPLKKFGWHFAVDGDLLRLGRDPASYYSFARQFMDHAIAIDRPFFLLANAHDPHRPLAGSSDDAGKQATWGYPDPVRTYQPNEVQTPGFLPDLAPIRQEVAQYYSSVRRADQVVGEVLRALSDAGAEEDTIVIFLSDHGMSFPYAKTNLYRAGTQTALIVKWPNNIVPGTIDSTHMVSTVDVVPTLIDLLGAPPEPTMTGRSFKPILFGQTQAGRDRVFAEMNWTVNDRLYPMRVVHGPRYSLIFNDWADGQTIFLNEGQKGLSWPAMQAEAQSNPTVAARVNFYSFRTPFEFYDNDTDPDARNNLIQSGPLRSEILSMRDDLRDWMQATNDPLLKNFQKKAY